MFEFTYNDTVADPVHTAVTSMNITWNSRGFNNVTIGLELWNGTYDCDDEITPIVFDVSAADGIYEVESFSSFIRNGSYYYIKAVIQTDGADVLYTEALTNGAHFTIEGRK